MTGYSFSTVLMAVIASNLLLALVVLCFFNIKLMINAGYKLLLLLVIFTALRFVLPFEIPLAIRFPLPYILSKPLGQLQYPGFFIKNTEFSFWNIVELIWLIGAFISLIKFIIQIIREEYDIILRQKVITNREPYFSILNKICSDRHKRNRFQVIELPGQTMPELYGIFYPRILVPENFQVSEQDLYCYLSHEATHHFHHDILIKALIKLITIVYWWNPFCRRLNDQADMVLEMRVDHSLTKSDSDYTIAYTDCLLKMAKRIIDQTQTPKFLSMSFIKRNPKKKDDKNEENVEKRVQMLLANQEKRNPLTNFIVFSSVAAIFLLSYVFILETYYTPPSVSSVGSYGFVSSENSYAILNGDGTYDIYCYGIKCETVTSLTGYPDNFPIYTTDHVPKDAPFEQQPAKRPPLVPKFPSLIQTFTTPDGAPLKQNSPIP